MAVIRQANLLGQQRLDVPHVRAIESAVAGDFDVLAGQMLAGGQSVILTGFRLSTSTTGGAATDLKLQVAGGAVMHYLASESGTIFSVPADRADESLSATNTKVIGSFTANQTNYIGIDFRRAADSTTADLVQFIDPNTGKETSATVPLARTLDYRIYISTTNFDQMPNVCPVAKVVTDSSNNVSTITDARQMMFRLGSGGTAPSASYVYPWAQGRNESTAADGFTGGDKGINSLKDWSDAVMTRLWELGGGEYWYANAADRNVNMIGTGSTFTNGEYFVWTSGTSTLQWKNLRFLFDNSTANYNTVADGTVTGVADGDCLYVDLNRSTNGASVTPIKGTLATLGTSAVPGNRYVIAWRNGSSVYTRGWRYAVGTTFTPATTTSTGVVQLNNTPGSATNPSVVSIMSNGQAEVTATANNSHGIKGTGNGSGPGIWAVAAGANALASYGGLYNHDSTTDWAVATRYGANTNAPALFSRKSRNASIGGNTIVANGDTLMSLVAQGANGTGYITAAQITAEVDGTPSSTSNDMPGRLVFWTTPDNATGSVPTERMRISSAGYVGINNPSPSTMLDISGPHAVGKGLAKLTSSSSIAALTFYPLGNYAGSIYGDTDGSIRLGTDGADPVIIYSNGVTNPRMTISNAGNVTINAPDSGNALTVNGNIALGGTSYGINFGSASALTGTTATSNILSDYEEGTWTPTLYAGSTAKTQVITATFTDARYTKIGRTVTVEARLHAFGSNASGPTGSLQVRGLPFAANGGAVNGAGGYGVGWQGFAVTNFTSPPFFDIDGSSATYADIMRLSSDGQYAVSITTSNVMPSWTFRMTLIYQVA